METHGLCYDIAPRVLLSCLNSPTPLDWILEGSVLSVAALGISTTSASDTAAPPLATNLLFKLKRRESWVTATNSFVPEKALHRVCATDHEHGGSLLEEKVEEEITDISACFQSQSGRCNGIQSAGSAAFWSSLGRTPVASPIGGPASRPAGSPATVLPQIQPTFLQAVRSATQPAYFPSGIPPIFSTPNYIFPSPA